MGFSNNEALSAITELSLGEDVAEHEQNLEQYFLQNSAYWAVINDRSDLILGAKGSGKSAIARYITSPSTEITDLSDVFVIPAFNVRGSILFRKLVDSEVPIEDESDFRDLFLAYMVGLVGNQIVENYGHLNTVDTLAQSLKDSGLRVHGASIRGVWSKVLSCIRPTMQFGMSPEGHPTVTAWPELSKESISVRGDESVRLDNLENTLEAIYDVLEDLNLRTWVVFDRLDEVFADARDLETPALRGLLRAHLDISSYGRRMRSKLFLRLDIFDRITKDKGFVNASHLRTHRINWSSNSVLHLVALRIVGGIDHPSLSSTRGIREICASILPSKMDGQNPLVWLLLVTVDASREYNPRNMLTLLLGAQLEQIDLAAKGRLRGSGHGAFLAESLSVGYKKLSYARLEDTIYAESALARPLVERLRGKKTKFTTKDLEIRFELTGASLTDAILSLRYAGFLRLDEGLYVVPALYRPALFVAVHGAENKLGKSELGLLEDDTIGKVSTAKMDAESTTKTNSIDVAASGVRRTRRRNRSRRSGRDELVPTGQKPEIADELDHAEHLAKSLEVPFTKVGYEGENAWSGKPQNLELSTLRKIEPKSSANEGKLLVVDGGADQRTSNESNNVDLSSLLLAARTEAEACSLIDQVLQRGDISEMHKVHDTLSARRIFSSGWLEGKMIVLKIMCGRPDAEVKNVASRITNRMMGESLISIFQASVRLKKSELDFWRAGNQIFLPLSDDGFPLRSRWALLSGARAMPIWRLLVDSDNMSSFAPFENIKNELFPGGLWSDAAGHINGYIKAYGRNRQSVSPQLLPYQVLSLAELLYLVNRLTPTLRAQVARELVRQLNSSNSIHRTNFKEWAPYSHLADDIINDPDFEGDSEVEQADASELWVPGVEILSQCLSEALEVSTANPPFVYLSALGTAMKDLYPNLNPREYGFSNLKSWALKLVEVDDRFHLMEDMDGDLLLLAAQNKNVSN